jgi:hypothetical protein
MNRPKANSNFFKFWSGNMAYILGFIVTDGCLVEHENGYNALNITNKNKKILENILGAMDSNHKISVKPRGGIPNLKYFQIQIRDKLIYADLLKLGLMSRKSKIVKMPNVPVKFFSDFVRGCFDGDGSVTVWQDPRWNHAWQIRAVFSSGSFVFLKQMQERLNKEAGLSIGSIQSLSREYNLCYSIADSMKLYDLMYRNLGNSLLYLKEKLDKFEFFRKIRQDAFKKRDKVCWVC